MSLRIVQLPNDSFYNTGISTYVWLLTKDKPVDHREHVLLVDASDCYDVRQRNIGNKRVDIKKSARDLIIKAYGEYRDATYETVSEDGRKMVCKARFLPSVTLGYNKITVESPQIDQDGRTVLKKGKPVADPAKRDTETVPLERDIDEYFESEVRPYSPDAWIDHSKDKVGYEIPFTRTFYEYETMEPADDIAKRIEDQERVLMEKLHLLFGKVGS